MESSNNSLSSYELQLCQSLMIEDGMPKKTVLKSQKTVKEKLTADGPKSGRFKETHWQVSQYVTGKKKKKK